MRWDCTRESRYLLLPEASAGTKQPCGGHGFQWGHEMPLGRGVPQGARKPILAHIQNAESCSMGIQRESGSIFGHGVFMGSRNASLNGDATAIRCDGLNGVRYPDSPFGRGRVNAQRDATGVRLALNPEDGVKMVAGVRFDTNSSEPLRVNLRRRIHSLLPN